MPQKKEAEINKITDLVILRFLIISFVLLVTILIYITIESHESTMVHENSTIHDIAIDILVHLTCASGIALLAVYFLKPLERLKNEDATTELSENITKSFIRNYDSVKYRGLFKVSDHFNQHEFASELEKSSEIKIMNTWIPDLDELELSIIKALNDNNCSKIKILLLNPNSDITEIRTKSLQGTNNLNRPSSHVKDYIEENLNTLSSICNEIPISNRNKIEIRLYNTLPSISFYASDEKQYIGIFFHKKLAIKSPQLLVHNSTTLGKIFLSEFNTIWQLGSTITDIENWRDEVKIMI